MGRACATCGHAGINHDYGGDCRNADCSCIGYKFYAAPPSPARSRAEAEKAIAAVLLDHQINILNSRGVECLCGWYLASEPTDTYEGLVAERYIRQHLASVLADLMADGSHDHGLICRPEETLTCGLCGETYLICKVCHADVYGHHQKCRGRADTEGDR